MPIIGVMIDKIEGNKVENKGIGVKVKNNTNITDVKSQILPGIEKEGLIIRYEYRSEYMDQNENKVGTIVVAGEIFYIDEKAKEIAEAWKRDMKLPDELNLFFINVALKKGVSKAIAISDELQLPPPIALPYAAPRKKEN